MSASGRDCKLEGSRSGRWRDADVFAGVLWPLRLKQQPFKQAPVAGATVCAVSGSVNTPTTGHRQKPLRTRRSEFDVTGSQRSVAVPLPELRA